MLQQDFNFVTTIQRGIAQNSIKSLMVLLNYVFENVNSEAYNDMIMFDLPLVLQSSSIEINEFFSRAASEENKYSLVSDLCNMETVFKEADLPVFSDVQTEYITLKYFKNPHNVIDDLKDMINQRDSDKPEDVQKTFEVEHFYINFTILIIGEKIRYQIENEEHGTNETYHFDQMQLSNYLAREEDNEVVMEFYQ